MYKNFFFFKRFSFQSENVPQFEHIAREFVLDKDIYVSGYTKEKEDEYERLYNEAVQNEEIGSADSSLETNSEGDQVAENLEVNDNVTKNDVVTENLEVNVTKDDVVTENLEVDNIICGADINSEDLSSESNSELDAETEDTDNIIIAEETSQQKNQAMYINDVRRKQQVAKKVKSQLQKNSRKRKAFKNTGKAKLKQTLRNETKDALF